MFISLNPNQAKAGGNGLQQIEMIISRQPIVMSVAYLKKMISLDYGGTLDGLLSSSVP